LAATGRDGDDGDARQERHRSRDPNRATEIGARKTAKIVGHESASQRRRNGTVPPSLDLAKWTRQEEIEKLEKSKPRESGDEIRPAVSQVLEFSSPRVLEFS
jgi:hypothetical protein